MQEKEYQEALKKGFKGTFKQFKFEQEEFKRILKRAEEIKKIDEGTDIFLKQTKELINQSLDYYKDNNILFLLEKTLNYAVKYKLLKPEKEKDLLSFVFNKWCEEFENESEGSE